MSLPRRVGEYRQDIVSTDDGAVWVVGNGSQDGLALQHEMSPPGRSVHDWICSQFTAGGVFLDVGAHVGHYTIRAARAGMSVFAVEAHPDTMARLALNVAANKVQPKVTLWGMAAWDQPAALEFKAIDGGTGVPRCGSATLAGPGGGYSKTGVTVAGMALDDLLAEVERVDLVKVDVEGADIRAMTGMMGSLVRLKPVIVWESHLFYGTYTPAEAAAVEHELEDFAGYRWSDIDADTSDVYRVGLPS